MKKVIPILVLILFTIKGYSKCAFDGLSFWPSGETIYENSIFVIEGYAYSQEIITGFRTTHKIYLKSGSEIVNLKVQEILVGQYNLTQAVLKPETKLKAGITYELIIKKYIKVGSIYRFDSTTNYKREKVKWHVISGEDIEVPKWITRPKYEGNSMEYYGCGPEAFAYFSLAAQDETEMLVKTVVKNLSTGVETSYYLIPENNRIKVGHGMCSGAFTFDESEDYEVEFHLIDASGNISKWSGDRLKFKRPT